MGKRANWQPRDFKTLDDLKGAMDAIESAHRAGTLRAEGAWSAGQVLDHCSRPMKMAFDGFGDTRVPWFVKAAGVAVFKPLLGKSHMKPGIKLPKSAASMLPPDAVSVEDGMSALRGQIARIDAGEKMTHASPVLGKMTHEQWVLLHLDHCRMHFGFLRY